MSNLQNRNPNNREIPPNENGKVPTNGNINNHTNVAPDRSVSYRDGYVHGRVVEQQYQEEGQEIRDNNNAARGLLLGIGLTALAGLTVGSFYLLNRPEEAPAPAPIVAPVPKASPSPSPAASQQPQERTTVIERTKIVPVPVEKPASQQPAPRVNVNVPQQPAPRVNVNVPPQPSSPDNTTINVTPSQPSSQTGSASNTTGSSSTTQTAPSVRQTQLGTPRSDLSNPSTETDSTQQQNKSGVTNDSTNQDTPKSTTPGSDASTNGRTSSN